jgi:septum site-determining protein MinC
MPTQSSLEIKGVRNGLLVHVRPDAEWVDVVRQLLTQIDRQSEFFKGARIALDVGDLSLRRQELGILQRMLSDRNVTLWAVLSTDATTVSTVRKLELQTNLVPPEAAAGTQTGARPGPTVAETLLKIDQDDGAPPPINPEETGTPGVLLKRTLRSGRAIRDAGHVVVIGDVNPGAEIIAGGDVIVWGRLRGMVHAGAQGDETAMVCALDMMPVQLRIAGHIATSPKDQRRSPRPEMAMVRDSRIVVEAWN